MIKKLEESYWRGDDYGKSLDPSEFGKKINELIDMTNEHEKRIGCKK